MQSLIDAGFKGGIYPVNPKDGEAFGARIYTSVLDIPDTVDYVISTVSAQCAPQLVADCAAKGVKAIHFFAAGFSEIEDEEGKQLESEIIRLARQSGIRVIGPNCMGLYCPATGLSFAVNLPEQSSFPKQSGTVGLLSQSGANSTYCIREASARGVYFSKAISYGNASDLNEADFMEYLTYDPATKIITAYVEGVKDGPRFARALKVASKAKPVIMFKGGATGNGVRTAASHTSAMAGSDSLWDSVLRQAGAIRVYSIEEIVDVVSLFLHMSPPKGRNTAIIGWGGGAGVKAADECSNAGLILPVLPVEIRQTLKNIYGTEAGLIFGNPVDVFRLTGSEKLVDSIKVIANSDQIDLLIIYVSFDIFSLTDGKDTIKTYVESILRLNSVVDKPIAVVLDSHPTDRSKWLASEAHVRLSEAGFPVYPSITRAADAISKFIQYHQWHQRNSETDD